jgi:branched-chain amino acid transport system substrate-binding protein
VWSGPAAGAVVLRSDPGRRLIVTDQARTQGFIQAVGPDAGATAGVCGCVEPGSSAEAALQSFVHAYQEETGLDPGPYAAEAYDAATVLAEAVGDGGRPAVAEALTALRSFSGTAGTYRWDARGDLIRPGIRTYQAEGVRWLPI